MTKNTERRGRQEPRLRIEPSGIIGDDGADAAILMAKYGFTVDPWQQLVLDAWLSRPKKQPLTYTECGLSVPRQNGKNAVLEARELYGLTCNGESILHTSHQVRTSKRAFHRLLAMFTDKKNRDLSDMVVEIRRTNGEEAIRLKNGASIEYSARSRKSARGFTVDVVVFDEAQELTDDQIEAIMPTLSAAPTGNRQVIYTGTPPGPNSPGTVFRRVRKGNIECPVPKSCWHEWSVTEIGDVLDPARWYETNPALGYRLTEDFCEKEARTLSEDGFARERLGWWIEENAAETALSEAAWRACAIKTPPTEGRKTFGVKFAPDGSAVALVACRMPKGAPAYCELVDVRPLAEGVNWLVSFFKGDGMRKTTAAICIDGRNGAGALTNALLAAYPKQAIAIPRTRDVVDATAMAVEAIKERGLTHWDNDEQEQLDESALTSVKRLIGTDGGWAFGGDESTPMEALCLAYWANRKTKRNPGGGSKLL